MFCGNAISGEMLESGVAKLLSDKPQVDGWTCRLITFQIQVFSVSYVRRSALQAMEASQ